MTHIIDVPDHVLTPREWQSLDREPYLHYELSEGVLVMAPRPSPVHQDTVRRIANALERVLPTGFVPVLDVEIAISSAEPPTYRAPDIAVVPSDVVDRRPRLDPSHVLMAVEVVSPNTVTDDRVTKRAQYETAGIGVYLVIDTVSADPGAWVHELIGARRYGSRRADWDAVGVAVPHAGDILLDLGFLTGGAR